LTTSKCLVRMARMISMANGSGGPGQPLEPCGSGFPLSRE
jgi:hypothetical protein